MTELNYLSTKKEIIERYKQIPNSEDTEDEAIKKIRKIEEDLGDERLNNFTMK